MFLFSPGGDCGNCGKRRAAVSVAAIAAASGAIVAALHSHRHGGTAFEGWGLASIILGAVVIVIAVVLLLVRWRHGQDSD